MSPHPNLQKSYFSWNQTTTYLLVGTARGVKSKIKLFNSVPCAHSDIPVIISNFNYRLSIGTSIFDFSKLNDEVDCDDICRGEIWTKNGFSIVYKDESLSLMFFHECSLQENEVTVIIDENSLILRNDLQYVHTVTEATKGVVLRFEVPDGHTVLSCLSSFAGYSQHERDQPSPIGEVGKGRQWAEIRSSSWLLPGISSVVSWK